MDFKTIKSGDKVFNAIFKHMQYIGYYTIYERFNITADDLVKFSVIFNDTFELYKTGKLEINGIITYFNKKRINILKWVHSIPVNQKLALADKKNCGGDIPFTIQTINIALYCYAMIADMVLIEHFNFITKNVNKFNNELNYYIDSYTRKQPGLKDTYLHDIDIQDWFVEEFRFDIKAGLEVL